MATKSKTRTKSPASQQAKKGSGPQEPDAGTSFMLNLDKQTAPANGTSPITANVEYIKDGQYAPGADITLLLHPNGTSAKFSNGTQEIHGTTKIDGTLKVPEPFTDDVAQSGTIEAYPTENQSLSQSRPFNFAASDTWAIDLEIEDDNALANKKDPITAKATVTRGGKSQPSQTVYFEISEAKSAVFTNGTGAGTQDTQLTSLSDGTASALFIDPLAETGSVTASINAPDNSNPRQTKSFRFTGPSDYKLVLDLSGDPGTAGPTGKGTAITAMATLTANTPGISVANKPILFELPDSDTAQFSNGGQSITVHTNNSGVASTTFTDTAFEEGTVQATLDIEPKQFQDQTYTFLPPSTLTPWINPLTTQTTDGSNSTVEFPSCPADGACALTVTGLVTSDTKGKIPWTGGGNVRLTLQGADTDTTTARFVETNTAQYDAPIQPNGTFTAQFVNPQFDRSNNDTANKGSVIGVVLTPDGDGPKVAPVTFQFTDPWTSVTKVSATFPPNVSTTTIYANGLNEAELTGSFTLSSFNEVKLTDKNQPSLPSEDTDIEKTFSLINYSSLASLNGLHGVWAYSLEDNGFTANVAGQLASAKVQPVTDANTNNIKNGVANITYYITNSNNAQSSTVAIGAAITPTGKLIAIGDGIGANNTPKGKTVPATIVYFASGYNKLTPAPTVNSLAAIDYKKVKIDVSSGPQSGQDDNIPSFSTVNYWRRCDYTITNLVDDSNNTAEIYKCELNAGFQSDYSFGERSNVIYNFKAYFWPDNVTGPNGTLLEGPGEHYYTMQSEGSGIQRATIDSKAKQLKATMFCAFGNVNAGASTYNPVSMKLFDNYGNYGLFQLNTDGTAFPKTYADVPGWNPIVWTTDPNPSGGSPTTGNNSVSFTNFDPDPDVVQPWNGDSQVSSWAGGPPLQLLSGAITQYTATSTNQTVTNDRKTYNITQSSGSYVQASGVDPFTHSGSSFVVTGSQAYTWRFAPLWVSGTVVISNDYKTFWQKHEVEYGSGDDSTTYWLVLTSPTGLGAINTPDGFVFLWKLQGG